MNQTQLIAVIRRNALIEDNFSDYSDQVIIDELNDAMTQKFERAVVEAKAGCWIHPFDTTTTVGQAEYRMPNRAIGLSKIEIATVGTSPVFVRLPQVNEDHIGIFQGSTTSRGAPQRFIVRGESVVLDPPPDNSGYTLRIWYYVRPPRIVQPQPTPFTGWGQASGRISAIDYTTGAVTLQSPITYWNGVGMQVTTAGGSSFVCDAVRLGSWRELSMVGFAFQPGVTRGQLSFAVGGTSLTAANPADLARVQVGDLLRIYDQTDWPSLPEDFHRSLADFVTAKILTQRSMEAKAQAFEAQATQDATRFVMLVSQRVMEEPYTYRAELPSLRGGGGRYWGGW